MVLQCLFIYLLSENAKNLEKAKHQQTYNSLLMSYDPFVLA